MSARNVLALVLTVISLVLLIPGLTEPALTITASMKLLGAQRELFRQEQSIVQAVRNLFDSKNFFVGCLVLLFSIVVPFIKAAILGVILSTRKAYTRYRLYLFVRSISKWAMADVFVVAIFIAFLAAVATDNLDAFAGKGFYYFAGYCLISNLAFQLFYIDKPEGFRR